MPEALIEGEPMLRSPCNMILITRRSSHTTYKITKEPLIKSLLRSSFPSGAKAPLHFVLLTARLKSCPVTKRTYAELP